LALGHKVKHAGTATAAIAMYALVAMVVAGCTGDNDPKGLLDPSVTGRWKHDALAVRILDHLDSGVEEPNDEFMNATEVRQEDLVSNPTDYTVGPADLLQVSISDLVGPGIDTLRTIRVSESGNITLPLLDRPVKAGGLTEQELQDTIQRAYREAGIIQRAQVSVQVLEQRNRTFSIMGAVGAPGQYAILPADMRLLQALVQARGVAIPDLQWMYIIRHPQTKTGAQGGTTTRPASGPGSEILEPNAPRREPTSLEPRSRGAEPDLTAAKRVALLQTNGADDAARPTTAPAAGDMSGRYIMVDGKPVLMRGADAPAGANTGAEAGGTAAAPPGATGAGSQGAGSPGRFEFNDLQSPENARVIKIPLDKLQNGDLRYNIVVKPEDLIIVPNPAVGEYYMAGHVGRPGVYSLTNRKITLIQAITSAGMFDPLGIPERTEIIRRVGPNQQVFVRVDLEKVWAGQIPDLYLKANDVVNVGTTWWASFLTAARGAFRMTYGFGFLYDRNFFEDPNLQNNNGRSRAIAPISATP